MGMMNFAHGEFIMLAAYALYVLAGLPFGVAVGGAVLMGVAIAVLAERVAFRPVRNADLSAQLVTSLAVATILQSVVTAAVDVRRRSRSRRPPSSANRPTSAPSPYRIWSLSPSA